MAGVAAILHNFYNGIENILKQILHSKQIPIPSSPSWHRDLLNTSENLNIITSNLKEQLGEYLAFRHFFSHAYALDLYAERMEPLVKHAFHVYSNFQQEIDLYINR